MQLRRRLLSASFPLPATLTSALFLGLLPYIAEAFPLFPRREPIVVDGNHVCVTPAPWTQIFSFFLTNYIARIATFKKTSGYEGSRDYFRTIVSLFVPFYGISQAASTIARGSRFLGKDELGRALHARTLCIVQRKQSWRPKNGDVVRGCIIEAPRRSKKRRAGSNQRYDIPPSSLSDKPDSELSNTSVRYPREEAILHIQPPPAVSEIVRPLNWKIQGQYSLPHGYSFARLPPGTSLGAINPATDRSSVVIASSYGIVKSFTAALQILFSIFALWSAYGSQVQNYGYAAFGFSVVPYTIMSFLNAIANIVEADYDTLFMVESEVMVEAFERTGEEFVGAVAAMIPAFDRNEWIDVKFRRHKERGLVAYELDLEDQETGKKWRVVSTDEQSNEEHQTAAEHTHMNPHDNPPAGPAGEQIPLQPRDTSHCTKIVIPGAGQYQRKKQVVKKSNRFYNQSVTIIVISALIFPYIILGALSRFEPRQSTRRQRIFMMGWLVAGQVIGILDVAETKGGRKRWWRMVEVGVKTVVVLMGFAFSIGGFMEAAQMMRAFGFCFNL